MGRCQQLSPLQPHVRWTAFVHVEQTCLRILLLVSHAEHACFFVCAGLETIKCHRGATFLTLYQSFVFRCSRCTVSFLFEKTFECFSDLDDGKGPKYEEFGSAL